MATVEKAERRDQRLKSWKEIAAYFGADERTVKRWEAKRGLPVHRLPGGARTTVYADAAELDSWLKGKSEAVDPSAAEDGRSTPLRPVGKLGIPRRSKAALAILLPLALLSAGAAYMLLPATPDKPRGIPPAVHRPPQEAVDLYSAGVFMWERRTPESLNRAVRYFNQAIARDPEYAEAYVGLANCYLLLREFTRMPASEAYPRAAEAARRALALNDRLSSAHAALAFVTFYWSQDFANGERSFRQAVALDPRSARARHWYATALMHKGEMSRALTQINQAQRLDPESHAILADKALIMFFAGQSDEAVKLLDQIVAVEPDFLSPHAYLAIINLAEGQYRPYLREARRAAALLGDKQRLAVIDAAHKGFDEGGVEGMLTARVKAEERFYAAGSELDYNLAATNALLGNEDAALTHLRRSVAKKEPPTLGLRVDPSFRVLRSNPKFVRLADGIGTPS